QPYWSWYGFESRVEWCACFVSWCYGQAGLSEPRFAACQSQGVAWFTSHGQWGAKDYENIAPGDAIFFDWDSDGSADHVGLVIGTDGSRVYTVEGNSGDACKIKSYSLDYGCIKGYGLMNWN
uniref:CHAP domain-containing protein n=1 Tax=Bacteroides pyogenes TaxID=310300 RepID=UPI002FDAFC9D